MNADLLLTGISQLATPRGRGARRGAEMRSLAVVEDAVLAIAGGKVLWAGRRDEWKGSAMATVDIGGRAVLPGLVDPHTHAVWAGNRLDDFDARTSGRSYEEILRAGGGIRSTVRSTAAASEDELIRLALPRVERLLHSGATTVEIKSGYGFAPEAELRSLEAIAAMRDLTPASLVATLLIHVPPEKPEERAHYLDEVCSVLIPIVAARKLASAVDVFVERETWSADEAKAMLACARAHGLRGKLHTEQFQRVGGLEMGVEMEVLSVDHLEVCTSDQFAALGRSQTIATILPGVSLHLGIATAKGRELIDAGAAVAVGTDLNPGSSPLYSMAEAMALAVRMNGLTAAEAVVAGTANAAAALGLDDSGRLEADASADFIVLEGSDWRELVYTLGANPVREVWARGKRVSFTDADRCRERESV